MKFEAVTIKDIARELGISTSTVSRALRDSYEISAETKRLVLECADRMQYRPNPIALSLKEKRSRSIGVIVCEIANSFFSQVINGIDSVAYSRGYNVMISQSHESFERELSDLDYLASRSIDGLIISISSATENIEHLQKLHERGLPIVFFDRISDDLQTHKVIVDNYKATYEATNYLLKEGYHNIACVLNTLHLSIAKERIAGYKQALTDAGMAIKEEYIKSCRVGSNQQDEVERMVNELLALRTRPDAIIGLSDRLTFGCLRALQRQKIMVPAEMGLVGFSNSEFTELCDPPLTVIRQPAIEMGEKATELLIDLIESKRPTREFERIVLETSLIVRKSSRKKTKQLLKGAKP